MVFKIGLGTGIAVKVSCYHDTLVSRGDIAEDRISVIRAGFPWKFCWIKHSDGVFGRLLVCEVCSTNECTCKTRQVYYLKGRTARAVRQRGATSQIRWLNMKCRDVRSCEQIELLLKGKAERRFEGRVFNT